MLNTSYLSDELPQLRTSMRLVSDGEFIFCSPWVLDGLSFSQILSRFSGNRQSAIQ
jgi:hypothetical protein